MVRHSDECRLRLYGQSAAFDTERKDCLRSVHVALAWPSRLQDSWHARVWIGLAGSRLDACRARFTTFGSGSECCARTHSGREPRGVWVRCQPRGIRYRKKVSFLEPAPGDSWIVRATELYRQCPPLSKAICSSLWRGGPRFSFGVRRMSMVA